MEDQLVSLVKVITLLGQLHGKLLEEAELKRKAIIEGDIVLMEEILTREQDLISNVEKAEDLRVKLMAFLKATLKIEAEPITITALVERLPENPHIKQLDKARDVLKAVLDKLRYRSRQNEELLKASVEHVKGFLKMISEASTVNKTYSPKGQSGRGGLRLVDKTA